jgi:glutathione S-transferase
LFGKKLTVADAMYAPVCARFKTYDVQLDKVSKAYCDTILAWPAVQEWTKEALEEPEDLDELDVEF